MLPGPSPWSPEAPLASQGPMAPGLDVVLLHSEPGSANHKLLALLLHKWGHRLALAPAAGLGQGAMRADLVLLDLDGSLAAHPLGEEGATPAGVLAWCAAARAADASPGCVVGMAFDRDAWSQERGALQQGLDGLLAKPVSPHALREALDGARLVQAPPASAVPAPAPQVPPAFDYGQALAQADAWVVEVIADDFIQGWPEQLKTLREAYAQGDAQTLRRAAHTLKGLAANFNADPVSQLARAMEQAGDPWAEPRFGEWNASLGLELRHLTEALQAFSQASKPH